MHTTLVPLGAEQSPLVPMLPSPHTRIQTLSTVSLAVYSSSYTLVAPSLLLLAYILVWDSVNIECPYYSFATIISSVLANIYPSIYIIANRSEQKKGKLSLCYAIAQMDRRS
jgi:hypothetical protein